LSDSDRIVRELGDFLTRLFSCHRFRFVIIFIILLDKFNRVRKNVVKVVKSATVLVIESLKFQFKFFWPHQNRGERNVGRHESLITLQEENKQAKKDNHDRRGNLFGGCRGRLLGRSRQFLTCSSR
jgi:hypothetical protein